jgi:hypothetical protein
MRYFNWAAIGVINDRNPRGQFFADSLDVVCRASGVQVQVFKLHCMQSTSRESADGILCSSEGDTWETSEFRVFALAVAPRVFPWILKTIPRGNVPDRAWTVFDRDGPDRVFVAEGLTSSMATLATDTRLGMGGWLSLDQPQNGTSEAALRFQRAWNSMDTTSLAMLGLPDHVVRGMQESSQLYSTNPFRLNTAQVMDAIAAALLAAKKSLPFAKNGRFQPKSLLEAMNNVSFDGASGHISFQPHLSCNECRTSSTAGDLTSAALTIRQVQTGQLVQLGTVGVGNEAVRTWRVRLTQGFLARPVDQPQRRSYHIVQYHTSGRGQQEQNVPAQMDWTSTIIKTVIGCVVVVMVCVSIPSRHNVRGWATARTVIDVRHPGGESDLLRTAHHDDEAVLEETESMGISRQ